MENKLNIPFIKMNGAGNDFIIIDARAKDFPKLKRSEFSIALCRRSFSIGANGVVFLEEPSSSEASFKWDFFNADGSHAEFCGNAARCVTKYFSIKNKNQNKMSFETAAGLVQGEVLENQEVKVTMPPPRVIQEQIEIPVGEHIKISGLYIDTGVPHIVKENDDWEQEYLLEMGDYLRHHALFNKSNGANATFFEVIDDHAIQSATFERGVESMTLACGTGAVASAFAARLKGLKGPLTVLVPGGKLVVDISEDLLCATLTGEARTVCEGVIHPGALL